MKADDAMTPWVTERDYDEPLFVLSAFIEHQPVLLESTQTTDRGRYSFLAIAPFEVLLLQEGECKDPFLAMKKRLASYPLKTIPDLPPFQGGMAGFLGYEFGCYLEKIPRAKHNDLHFPDLHVGLYDLVIAWDHDLRKSTIFSSGYPENNLQNREKRAKDRIAWAQKCISHRQKTPKKDLLGPFMDACEREQPISANFTRDEYEKTVCVIQEAIRAGDIFQANIAQRFQVNRDPDWDPMALYAHLSAINPAPFAGFCALGHDQVLISASPERLFSLRDKQIEACPIKGTITRDKDPAVDQQCALALQNSEKDRAENVMIVDLLRNDLSKVCLPHQVLVKKLCQLESFATVHHLVSEITGTLLPDRDAIDVIKAIFPGGSVTGAPKIRAMEWIAAVEPVVRGPYCGSLGYIGFNGDADFSILIRTFVVSADLITFHAGGAITLDSDPLKEYEETLLKASALKRALKGVRYSRD